MSLDLAFPMSSTSSSPNWFPSFCGSNSAAVARIVKYLTDTRVHCAAQTLRPRIRDVASSSNPRPTENRAPMEAPSISAINVGSGIGMVVDAAFEDCFDETVYATASSMRYTPVSSQIEGAWNLFFHQARNLLAPATESRVSSQRRALLSSARMVSSKNLWGLAESAHSWPLSPMSPCWEGQKRNSLY